MLKTCVHVAIHTRVSIVKGMSNCQIWRLSVGTCVYTVIHLLFFLSVESRLKTDPELKKKLLSVAATLQEGLNSLVVLFEFVDQV